MAFYLTTFIGKHPNTLQEWTSRLESANSPVKIKSSENVAIDSLSGCLPISFNGFDTYLEVYVNELDSSYDLLREKLAHQTKTLTFRWQGDEKAFESAHALALNLVQNFDAKAFGNTYSKFLTVEELQSLANGIETDSVKVEYQPKADSKFIRPKQDFYSHCQWCSWRFPTPRTTDLCAECNARCKICGAYKSACQNPGMMQLAMWRTYYKWVAEKHKRSKSKLDWTSLFSWKKFLSRILFR